MRKHKNYISPEKATAKLSRVSNFVYFQRRITLATTVSAWVSLGAYNIFGLLVRAYSANFKARIELPPSNMKLFSVGSVFASFLLVVEPHITGPSILHMTWAWDATLSDWLKFFLSWTKSLMLKFRSCAIVLYFLIKCSKFLRDWS